MCAQSRRHLDDGRSSPIRALHSLTHTQADAVEALLPRLPGGWSAERHEAYDGHLSLMLVPEAGDEAGLSLVVHRDERGLRLDLTRWDAWERVGCYDALEALLEAVLVTATSGVAAASPRRGPGSSRSLVAGTAGTDAVGPPLAARGP